MKSKTRYFLLPILLVLALFLIFWLISWIFLLPPSPAPGSQPKNTGSRYAKPPQRVEALDYTEYEGSRRIFSLGCRHLAVHRKKTGFVRFALMKEAVLSDAHMKLYLYPEEPSGYRDDSGMPVNPAEPLIPGPKQVKKPLETLTRKESRLLSQFQNITSIRAFPVTLEVYVHGQLASSLSAGLCTITLSTKKIEFTQKVVLVSGPRKLSLDRLELNPDTMLLTGNQWVLHAPEGESAGQQITTDFSLTKGFE